MNGTIIQLDIADYEKCGNIWDMQRQRELAEMCRKELVSGNRMTYVYVINGMFVGEVSIVKDKNDPDYTIPGQRIYLSRLIVKDEFRRKGIGKRLIEYAVDIARSKGYPEISVGVDSENYGALKLYEDVGFDRILYIGEDEYGKFLKLLKVIGN